MQPTRLTSEHINTLIEQQLEAWPEARENFSRIKDTSRRVFRLGALNCGAQLNPARIKSTGASIDSKSIEARPCFLCKSNRTEPQITVEWMPGQPLPDSSGTLHRGHYRPQAPGPDSPRHGRDGRGCPRPCVLLQRCQGRCLRTRPYARTGCPQIGTSPHASRGEISSGLAFRIHEFRAIWRRTPLPFRQRCCHTRCRGYEGSGPDTRFIRH